MGMWLYLNAGEIVHLVLILLSSVSSEYIYLFTPPWYYLFNAGESNGKW